MKTVLFFQLQHSKTHIGHNFQVGFGKYTNNFGKWHCYRLGAPVFAKIDDFLENFRGGVGRGWGLVLACVMVLARAMVLACGMVLALSCPLGVGLGHMAWAPEGR